MQSGDQRDITKKIKEKLGEEETNWLTPDIFSMILDIERIHNDEGGWNTNNYIESNFGKKEFEREMIANISLESNQNSNDNNNEVVAKNLLFFFNFFFCFVFQSKF
jgi:hypothetical protein